MLLKTKGGNTILYKKLLETNQKQKTQINCIPFNNNKCPECISWPTNKDSKLPTHTQFTCTEQFHGN